MYKWWMSNTIGFPITDHIQAVNYFTIEDGQGVVIGTNYILSKITVECFQKLIDLGYMTKYCHNGYFFGK